MHISYIIIENYNPMRKGIQRLYFEFSQNGVLLTYVYAFTKAN